MSLCAHENVVPELPAHLWQSDPSRSSIEGFCLDCGEGGFVWWEAYDYRDARDERPWPTFDEVLADFEAWWERLGTRPAPPLPNGPDSSGEATGGSSEGTPSSPAEP